MVLISHDDYARIFPTGNVDDRLSSDAAKPPIDDSQLDVIEAVDQTAGEDQVESAFVPIVLTEEELSTADYTYANLESPDRRPRWVKGVAIVSAAGLAATLGVVAGFATTSGTDELGKPAAAPSASAAKTPGGAPSKKAQSATPTSTPAAASELSLPAAWQDCKTPQMKFSVSATSGVVVNVSLKNGSEAPVLFKNGKDTLYPQASYFASLGAAVCIGENAKSSAVSVDGSNVTIDRAAFSTVGLFPVVNDGSANTETIPGMDSKTPLAASANISSAEAARINNLMLATGKNHAAYTQTIDTELRDGILRQVTASEGADMSAKFDISILAALKAANPKSTYTYTFDTHSAYPSLAVSYELANAGIQKIDGVALCQSSICKPLAVAAIIASNQGGAK